MFYFVPHCLAARVGSQLDNRRASQRISAMFSHPKRPLSLPWKRNRWRNGLARDVTYRRTEDDPRSRESIKPVQSSCYLALCTIVISHKDTRVTHPRRWSVNTRRPLTLRSRNCHRTVIDMRVSWVSADLQQCKTEELLSKEKKRKVLFTKLTFNCKGGEIKTKKIVYCFLKIL